MWTYELNDDRIFAAIDELHAPDWNVNNRHNASSDGLSGKIEGFYFANWLMPFKIPFAVENVFITPKNFPICLKSPNFNCQFCQFFNKDFCPILKDERNLILTQKGFNTYQKLIYWPRGNKMEFFISSRAELLSHGRPLHFQVVRKMLTARHPEQTITDRKVHNILRVNPIFFQDLGEGVYKAIPGVPISAVSPEFLAISLLEW